MATTPSNKNNGNRSKKNVSTKHLNEYKRMMGPVSLNQDCNVLSTFMDDCERLAVAGDRLHASGAGLLTVDLALNIATTPSRVPAERRRKTRCLRRFKSWVTSFGHPHVATLIESALVADRVTPATQPDAPGQQPAKGDAPTQVTTEPGSPQQRLGLYANRAKSRGDLQSLLNTMHRLCIDHAILDDQGRTDALQGAERMLADFVRRLCAFSISREEEGRAKVDVLSAMKPFYALSASDAPMLAMIDAAVALEIEP